MLLAALAAPLMTVSAPVTTDLADQSPVLEQPGPEQVAAPAVVVPVMPAPQAPASQTTEQVPAAQTQAPGQENAAAAEPADPNEILVSGRAPSAVDPVERINVVSYEVVQSIDEAVTGPIAKTYNNILPEPVRDGVHNVLDNLDEPIVFINFLLQLKPGKAMETAGRFLINSTIGVAGLFDIAKRKPFNLPRRSNGLADTLGYYGVGTGPYLYLPIIGATTLRDMLARPVDLLVLPAILHKPFADPKVALGKGVLSALDERAQNDEKLAGIHSAKDPYLVQREEYLARRKAEIEVLQGKRKSIYDPPYYIFPDTGEPVTDPASPPAAGPAVTPAPAPSPAPAPEPVAP